MSITSVSGVKIPDSNLTREISEFVRDTESSFLFEHSLRVFFWGALSGKRRKLSFDLELFYAAAMFHDIGLTEGYRDSKLRFEVDGANAAAEFLRSHGIAETEVEKVWLAIALHTTPGIPRHLHPIAQLTADGVMMDIVGAGSGDFTEEELAGVETSLPHPPQFAEDFLQALFDGLGHRPETTQGTGLADVLADKDPNFHRRDFCKLMRNSCWCR